MPTFALPRSASFLRCASLGCLARQDMAIVPCTIDIGSCRRCRRSISGGTGTCQCRHVLSLLRKRLRWQLRWRRAGVRRACGTVLGGVRGTCLCRTAALPSRLHPTRQLRSEPVSRLLCSMCGLRR